MPTPKKGYTVNGKKIPSVTTVIGRFKDSSFLIPWAYKQGREHENLAACGLPAPNTLYEVVNDAANIGTLVHGLVDDDIHGIPYSLDSLDERIISAFNGYLSWKKTSDAIIVATEIPLVSQKYGYGGTPDAIAKVKGDLCLMDWKTSARVYTDHLLQLAAYRQLWNENNPNDLLVGGSHILRFDKTHGNFDHHYFPNLDDAFKQFLLLLEAYTLDKELSKQLKESNKKHEVPD